MLTSYHSLPWEGVEEVASVVYGGRVEEVAWLWCSSGGSGLRKKGKGGDRLGSFDGSDSSRAKIGNLSLNHFQPENAGVKKSIVDTGERKGR
jgi:hypothetical protein